MKIVLIVFAKSKPRGAFHHAAFGLNRSTIFPEKAQSQMFGWIPNVLPIVGVVNVE